jgi:hypothetical protein
VLAGLAATAPAAPAATTAQQRAALAAARQRFAALHARSYTLRVRWCCSDANAGYTGRSADGSGVLTVIRGHARHHATTSYFGRLSTVGDLFRAVSRTIGRHDFSVRYSRRTGIPLSLSYDLAGRADSRRALKVTGFHRL